MTTFGFSGSLTTHSGGLVTRYVRVSVSTAGQVVFQNDNPGHDSYITLFAANGGFLGSNDNGASAPASELSIILQPGDYFLAISDVSAGPTTQELLDGIDGPYAGGPIAFNTTINAADGIIASATLEGGETITGTSGDDTLYGLSGDDVINPLGGTNNVYGGSGNDTINAAAGSHFHVFGQDGDDTLSVTDGDGTFDGGAGNDTLTLTLVSTAAVDNGPGSYHLTGVGDLVATNIERLIFNGGSFSDTVTGTAGDDVMNGGRGDDIMHGGGGNDTLIGGSNSDQLYGEGGDDYLDGSIHFSNFTFTISTGGNTLVGGAGNDIYVTYTNADTMVENPGEGIDEVRTNRASFTLADNFENLTGVILSTETSQVRDQVLTGNTVANVITGGPGNDTLNGLTGDDTLAGGAGNDTMAGGLDNDIYYVADAGDTVIENVGEGTDEVRTTLAAYVLAANVEQLTGIATTGQSLTGNGLDNVIAGGAGDDTISAMQGGTDTVTGGAGSDRLVIDGIAAAAGYNATLGGDGSYSGTVDYAGGHIAFSGIESFSITGGGGDDNIVGGVANDSLDGGAGADHMTGGAGNDVYFVDNAGDVVTENAGEGIDEIRTALASYTLGLAVETLTYTGSAQSSLRANGLDNVVNGGSGTDIIDLRDGGNDHAFGGSGDDLFYYGTSYTAADQNDGGAGTQDVVVLQGNYNTTLGASSLVGVEYLALYSGSVTSFGDVAGNNYDYNIISVEANVGAGQELRVNGSLLGANESFTFNGSAETDGGHFLVYGGAGVDTFIGGAGNDGFYFEGARFGSGDKVDGGAGSDVLILRGLAGVNTIVFGEDQLTSIEAIAASDRFATTPNLFPSYNITLAAGNMPSSGTLTVNGSTLLQSTQTFVVDGSAIHTGNLKLYGGAGGDTLTGGSGDDLLFAAAGGDTLTGGGGADTFQYRSTTDSTTGTEDHILDFTSGADRIDLHFIDADTINGGDQAFSFIGEAAFSGQAGELRTALDSGSGDWLIQGDTDGNGQADFQIIVHTAAPLDHFSAGDFLL